ncbi:MAG: hypothetical protein BWK74_07510 [Desulfobacteraceae bacterium A6]|nr:MAG: hypothetical protein BWK74_07510 [Desulfobacteraceae bacterium A6]
MTHHDNHNHHNHETASTLSFDQKMAKLLEHWIKHNKEHAETYRDWAKKAKNKDMGKVFILLEDAAAITEGINKKFEEALRMIPS